MNSNIIATYQNGNALINLHSDGTRIIEYPDSGIRLDYPLNIDIRVSSRCAFGMNPKTGKAICDFCHESATTDGYSADLDYLYSNILSSLPAGIELAVGINEWNNDLLVFLKKCKMSGWIVNGTINQGHIRRDKGYIKYAIEEGLVNGLGVSFRSGMIDIPEWILSYDNTVVHVIAGIDPIDSIKQLSEKGIRKILVLGEKDFGFNLGKVKIVSESHIKWFREVHSLFNLFDVVSFDNLALEQLNIRRFVKNWEELYQHEYSFYINAVDGYFADSSRSDNKTSFGDVTIKEYFKKLFPEFTS
jgi:hypothetical protein